MADAAPVAVRRALMDLLARREHSATELLDKTRRRFPGDAEMIEEEIGKLRAEGLQSDARMAESFVAARVGRGQGPAKIRAGLRAHRISDEIIRNALTDAGVDWEELAREVAKKRFGASRAKDARDRARRIRFLEQRGFLFDHVRWLR